MAIDYDPSITTTPPIGGEGVIGTSRPDLEFPEIPFIPSSPVARPLPVDTPQPTMAYPPTDSPHADGRIACPLRPVTLKRRADFRRHMLQHQQGARKHVCPVTECNRQDIRGFTRKDKLREHVRAKHPNVSIREVKGQRVV